MSDTSTIRTSRPRKTSFNRFVEENRMIMFVPSSRSPPQKETLTSPSNASSSGTQLTLRLRAMETIANTKQFMKGVCKIIRTKLTPRFADYDVHGGFDNALDPYLLAGVGQNSEDLWIQHVRKEWIKTA